MGHCIKAVFTFWKSDICFVATCEKSNLSELPAATWEYSVGFISSLPLSSLSRETGTSRAQLGSS